MTLWWFSVAGNYNRNQIDKALPALTKSHTDKDVTTKTQHQEFVPKLGAEDELSICRATDGGAIINNNTRLQPCSLKSMNKKGNGYSSELKKYLKNVATIQLSVVQKWNKIIEDRLLCNTEDDGPFPMGLARVNYLPAVLIGHHATCASLCVAVISSKSSETC